MNYKKTISMIVAVVMVFCNWITVIAHAKPNTSSLAHPTTLKLEVVQPESDYTLVIPAEVTL